MMEPLFNMYLNAIPVVESRSRVWYGHPGGYFPETMFFWGTYESAGMKTYMNGEREAKERERGGSAEGG